MIKRLPEKVHCDFPSPSAGIKLSHPFRQCSNLPPQMRVEIKKLSGPRSRPFLTQLLVAWIIILSAIALACHFQTWWMTVLAILIVASRQNVLGLLVHDQAHKLGLRGEMGDKFTNLFAAYPILVLTVEDYAKVHLAHHKYYFTDKDPDHLRKSGNEWQVPTSKIELFRLFARDLSGLSTYKLIRGKTTSLNSEEFGRTTPKLMRPIFFLTIISVLSSYLFLPLAGLSPLLASPRSHYLSIDCSVGCSYRAYLQYPGDESRRQFPIDHPDMDKPSSPAKS